MAGRVSPKLAGWGGGGGDRSLDFSSLGPDEFQAWTLGKVDLGHSMWERQAFETGHRP